MSLGVLVVIRCDSCGWQFPESFVTGDSEARKASKEQGWKQERRQLPGEEATALLDICPDCQKEKP